MTARVLSAAVVLCLVATPLHAEPLGPIRKQLIKRFDTLLENPEQFRKTVAAECKAFPEGQLFSYLLPAMAYTNLGMGDKAYRPTAQKRVEQLIALARPVIIAEVNPPGKDLAKLIDYGRHATALGQYNLVLAGYRLLGGDGRFDTEHAAISNALHRALARAPMRPLASYPHLTWTFDTIPVLLSLKLYDHRTKTTRSAAAIEKHLQWIERRATDKATGLPFSTIDRTGKGAPPRGCDLSWRICLMAQLDSTRTQTLYAAYAKSFWLDQGLVAGFAEWPRGRGKQDIDSGPIVLGVGSTATGLGIGAAAACDDGPRLKRLVEQVAGLKGMMKLLIMQDPSQKGVLTMGGIINPDSAYATGFLYGDVSLFYAVTYHPWISTREFSGPA